MAKRWFTDTDEEAERVLIELNRAMPDGKKWQIIISLIESSRQLAIARLKERYPEADEEELKKRYAALVLDLETVRAVYNWDPEVEGY